MSQPTDHFFNGCSRRQMRDFKGLHRQKIFISVSYWIKRILTCFCRHIWREKYRSLLKKTLLHLNIIEIYDACLDWLKSSSNKPYRELELNEVIGSIAYQAMAQFDFIPLNGDIATQL